MAFVTESFPGDQTDFAVSKTERPIMCLPQEMLKYSKNCEGAEDLQEALTSILGILKAVNDSMHQIAITGYDVSSRFFIISNALLFNSYRVVFFKGGIWDIMM